LHFYVAGRRWYAARSMRCPVCEAENPDDVLECGSCGRSMVSQTSGEGEIRALEGLELTRVAEPDLAVQVAALPGLEGTQLEEDAGSPPQWTVGPLRLERTQHEAAAGATPAWTADLELDLGREADSGKRTPMPPETATCPFCEVVALGAVCDACGRQKSRYLEPAPREEAVAASGETVTCPSCFARVPKEIRCSDCGVPFPLQEL